MRHKRPSIVHPGAGSLKYAIREIVALAHQLAALGLGIIYENIGDPTQKGEELSEWISDIIRETAGASCSYGYCDTAGVPATREFLAQAVNTRGGVRITLDDILFFNGVGDVIAHVYGYLNREARVLGPSPAYSTHSSAEAAHSGYTHLTYDLDPYDGWMPDVKDIRNKVKYNDTICGILLISPDNPTGAVYPRDLLLEIAAIAREYGLFIIADEIYRNIVFNGNPRVTLAEWIDDVPGLAMCGISKEFPWPGARCGWLEIFNLGQSPDFAAYVDSLLAAKRLEVCSTTLPQLVIPKVMGDARYPGHLLGRQTMFEARAKEATAAFVGCDSVVVNEPGGAFYLTVMFKDGVLNYNQTLPIDDARIRSLVEESVQDVTPDKRFVHYLMGATGIVVVPLTGFECKREGFRMTLLETDDTKRAWIFTTVRQAIDAYVNS